MLKKLSLENFRNHKRLDLEFEQGTVLFGQNGAGKTNILESLVLIAFCKSFREENKQHLINKESEYARIVGDDLELAMMRTPKFLMKAKIEGVPKKLADFIGRLPAVVLSPEMISIINGSPGEKRKFLDILLSQVDKEYLLALSQFKKVRYQRNILLQKIQKREGREEELKFWDEKFLELSSLIMDRRAQAVAEINKNLPYLYQQISLSNENLKINYVNNFTGALESVLLANRAREIAAGMSIYGPHRDDLSFILNSLNAANYASRGELKSILLALKVSELEYINNINKKRVLTEKILDPVLLLDDIFSEFDAKRRECLEGFIYDYQSLLTTADLDGLPIKLRKNCKIIEVSNG